MTGSPRSTNPTLLDRLRAADHLFLPAYEARLGRSGRDAYKAVLRAHACRTHVNTRLGHRPVLPETALRRALLVGSARQNGVKKIVCLGDDDFGSLALARLGHRVTVYDIDDHVIEILRQVSGEFSLEMQIEKWNLMQPLLSAQTGHFDLFFACPVANVDCLEVFFSRALALVGPGGRGYVAVSGRMGRLFHDLAARLRVPILTWHARFNRYCSPSLQLSGYESDWVEVAKTPETTFCYAADEPILPLEIYQDEASWRPTRYLAFFDNIEGAEHTQTFFLDLLINTAERHAPLSVHERHRCATADWSTVFAATRGGYLAVHIDRPRRQIILAVTPQETKAVPALFETILRAHKSTAAAVEQIDGNDFCEVRVK
jgi:hypothetical protein